MRLVINFTLNQVSLVIDVEMFDSTDTTELIVNDHYNRKKHTQKIEMQWRENQITHGILFLYSMVKLSHRLINGTSCNNNNKKMLYHFM